MNVFKTMGVIGRLHGAAKVIAGDAEAVAPGTGERLADLAEQTRVEAMDAEVVEVLRKERDQYKIRAEELAAQIENRRAEALFATIEGICAQRDTWQNMWRIHVSEHSNAQHLLESVLTQTRVMLGKTIAIVNEYRKRDGQPLLERPSDIDAASPPVGTAEAFDEKMTALATDPTEAIARIPDKHVREIATKVGLEPIDGMAERDRIMAAEALKDEL